MWWQYPVSASIRSKCAFWLMNYFGYLCFLPLFTNIVVNAKRYLLIHILYCHDWKENGIIVMFHFFLLYLVFFLLWTIINLVFHNHNWVRSTEIRHFSQQFLTFVSFEDYTPMSIWNCSQKKLIFWFNFGILFLKYILTSAQLRNCISKIYSNFCASIFDQFKPLLGIIFLIELKWWKYFNSVESQLWLAV